MVRSGRIGPLKAITVNTGPNHSVGELAGTGTSLGDYSSSIACTRNGSAANSGSGTSLSGIAVAKNDVIVAQWTPTTLTWCAATLAQSGQWHSWSNDGSHGTMTFKGSTATNLGGSMSMFTSRIYQYDDTLTYLQPPWFPTLSDAYTISLFRERAPGYTLP